MQRPLGHRLGKLDAARSASSNQRRDIHPAAENVVLLRNHVAKVDADAELDTLIGRGGGIALGHAALDLDSAPDSIDHALELGKEAVPGVLYDAAPVLGDLGVDQFPEMGLQPFVSALLIRPPSGANTPLRRLRGLR